MICRNLCAVVNLSLSLGWLSSFQPRTDPPPARHTHRGETRDEAHPGPLCSDARRDAVSSLAGCEELQGAALVPGPAVTPGDPSSTSLSSPVPGLVLSLGQKLL